MSCNINPSDINQTFIIEQTGAPNTGSTISADTIYSNFYYSGTTSLTDVILSISPNFYTTGTSIYNNIAYFDRTDQLSAYTLNLSEFLPNIYVTGASLNLQTKVFSINQSNITAINTTFPFRLFNSASTSTNSNIITTIDTITGITNNTNVFLISYVTAYKDNIDYGFWKRTLAINKSGGVINIIGENSDFDRVSSGLTSNNIVYSAIAGNLLINVIGESSKNYTWSSNWEVIT